MYYLLDRPKRGFVREELMVVPSDTKQKKLVAEKRTTK